MFCSKNKKEMVAKNTGAVKKLDVYLQAISKKINESEFRKYRVVSLLSPR